jgi:hypothetical protein
MDSNTIGAGGGTMAQARQQVSSNGSIYQTVYPTGMILFSATILIVLGIAFQAAEIGWVRLWPNNLWLFSVIVPGLWNMLAVEWNAPIFQELLKFWPLALVATGMAMLLIQTRAHVLHGSGRTQNGGNHDE